MNIAQAFLASQHTTSEAIACRRVVDKYMPSVDTRFGPPDLETLINREQISVHESDSISAEGMYRRASDGTHSIVIRKAMNRRRQRFTLAHELAHYIIRKEVSHAEFETTEDPSYRKTHRLAQQGDDEERIADLLAAELLLPHDAVLRIVGSSPSLSAVKTLCREFGVSRVAAIRRVADVVNRTMCFLTLVPRRFVNLSLPADLDEALFAFPARATVYGRQFNALKSSIPFECLGNGEPHLISLSSSFGPIDAYFETEIVLEPQPHAFAFTSLEPGWRE